MNEMFSMKKKLDDLKMKELNLHFENCQKINCFNGKIETKQTMKECTTEKLNNSNEDIIMECASIT